MLAGRVSTTQLFYEVLRLSWYLRWKEDLVKHQKFSKYDENGCLQNFLLLFMSLLAAPIARNIYI